MTPSNDPSGAMASLLSPDQVERLLTGAAVPGELDAGASRVAGLLSAMHLPAVSTAPGMEQQTVAAIVEAIRQAPQPLAAHRRSRMLTQLLSAKAAVAAATLAALLAGGTAAAATGSLPVPAQSAVSSALSHVGVSIPHPNSHANPHATDNPHRAGQGQSDASDRTSGAQGPDATSAAKYGLCRAWAATPTPNSHSRKNNSVAFTNVQKAADAAGMSITDYCEGVTPPTGTDEATPTTLDHAPPVSTPNSGGTHTGDTASGGASSNGTSNAPPAAADGSANSTTHTTDGP
jgi:hypothetical protein